ncbi:MAG: cytidylate kinase-like family protein [Oscillospiraceae bacterium]|nr:cytidylate kinase-like family protein [Oscillospiraceae bacterium]
MNNDFIITISRSSGSGGKEIAQLLSRELGVPFYDTELLAHAAENSGMNPDLFEANDEKPTNSFLYSIVAGRHVDNMPLNQKLFMAQFETIKKLADEGPCIFLGRCSDYALRDDPRLVSVFVHAPEEYRIAKTMELYSMDEKKARAFVNKTDKNRSGYYNFYSGRRWGDIDNYHLAIDTSVLGIPQSARFIIDFARCKSGGNV